MKKIYLKLTALAITAAMLLAFSACGGEEPSADSTDPALVESAAVTSNETETPSDVEAESQAVPASGEEPATQNGGGTDTPSTSKSPVTDNQAALTLYNNAANDVKSSKPAMTKERWTEFESLGKGGGSLEFLRDSINKLIPRPQDEVYSNGTNYNEIFPAIGQSWSSKLTLNEIQSISCTDDGSNYIVDMTLVSEDIPTSVTDYSTTKIGKAMAVNPGVELQKGVESVNGKLTGWDQTYHDCTIHAVVDKNTGKLKETTHTLYFSLTLKGNVVIPLPSNGVTVNLKITEIYTFS
ncbi:MAG TPA: hypothetical protein IAB39_00245 [Candidatus Onthovicinus excrementipullorum]|nr:hypothetical protein [Candidatus Onthovicinus excrementipullorum]